MKTAVEWLIDKLTDGSGAGFETQNFKICYEDYLKN